jgi:hypothetical protein
MYELQELLLYPCLLPATLERVWRLVKRVITSIDEELSTGFEPCHRATNRYKEGVSLWTHLVGTRWLIGGTKSKAMRVIYGTGR